MKSVALGALAAATLASAAAAAPVETFVDVKGPSGVLKGTMLAPEGGAKAPVALIIPGSGPTDRDGNNPLGVKGQPYKLLAEGLAPLGVATVRIDKRGMFASAGAGDPSSVTMADYGADVHAWASMLVQKTGAPCVWLVGHSEGSLVAEIAAQDPHDICGLVLISGPGRKLGDVLRQQLKANPANAPILDQALGAIASLEAGKRVDPTTLPAPLQPLFAAKVQGYLISFLSYDPAALLKAYKGPVIVIQGTTDLQVSLEDAHLLAGSRPGVKLVELEGVNHVLKVAPADRGANIATYADPSLPLAPGVAEAVAGFIKGGK
jgi:pimeloyl-ACP methyl ester carboxylesterase